MVFVMPQNLKKIKQRFLKINLHWQKYWWQYSLGGVFLCLLLSAFAFRELWQPRRVLIEESLPFRHPLTGERAATEIVRPQVYSVMVENFSEAWPLAGVEEAFLVIEAPVEAEIPRFEAFYYEGQSVEKIGPVRSARPYYLDWAEEFDALYAHCGGSPAALSLISAGETLDLNEFWNGKYFWRADDRYAPHNIYTSSELLTAAATFLAVSEPSYGLWTFKDDQPAENLGETDLFIEDGLAYRTGWHYDSANNNYIRWQGSANTTSEDGEAVVADNVAVVYTPISVLDQIGRLELETVGQGTAMVFQDGRKIPAVWKKESADERLRFFAEDGKEISWNAGTTWIEVISTSAFGY
jgi:hypothetical protein